MSRRRTRRRADGVVLSPGDARLLHRAARSTALQATALVAAVALAVVALVGWLMLNEQRRQVDDLLARTATVTDDVKDPPPQGYLVLQKGNRTASSEGLPAALAAGLARLRQQPPAPGVNVLTEVGTGETYRVLTRTTTATDEAPGALVQVAIDEARWTQDRLRIVEGAGLAALAGLVLSLGAGLLLARRAVRPLGAALALQRRFVTDASHELRAPLTLLTTRAQVVARALEGEGGASTPEARSVAEDARRLAEALDDLLAAAGPEAADGGQDTDLVVLVADVLASARAHARALEVRLEFTPGNEHAVARCRAAAVRRALVALVENALTHTPAGGTVTVSIRCTSRRHVLLAVQDTGPGVSAQLAPRLFDRSVSGGRRRGRPSFGLGLALAREVAEGHGGELRLAAGDGEGARFELLLPTGRGTEKFQETTKTRWAG